jgi:hypothetical protein
MEYEVEKYYMVEFYKNEFSIKQNSDIIIEPCNIDNKEPFQNVKKKEKSKFEKLASKAKKEQKEASK